MAFVGVKFHLYMHDIVQWSPNTEIIVVIIKYHYTTST